MSLLPRAALRRDREQLIIYVPLYICIKIMQSPDYLFFLQVKNK